MRNPIPPASSAPSAAPRLATAAAIHPTAADPVVGTEGEAMPPNQRPRVAQTAQDEWVTLNVGGTLVTTTRTTLCADPRSLLHTMFSPDAGWPLDRDAQGNVLLDQDPQYFMPLLNFLRLNEVVIPPAVAQVGVLAAATYFNVQGVLDYFSRDRRQQIFSWGNGGSGELGTLDKADVSGPGPVTIVPYNARVAEVALGAGYSCVLTTRGKVLTFGNGDWGQLGLGSPKNFFEKAEDKTPIMTIPTVVKGIETKRVVSVATGYAYAMALTESHEVYFWGNNNHGQSGLGAHYFGPAFRKIEEPMLVHTLQGKGVIQLGCGSFFVLALGGDGAIYSWGLVDCLGLGPLGSIIGDGFPEEDVAESVSKDKRTVLLSPRKVAVPTTDRVVRINAGQWHSCAITANGELYTWGVGFQGRLGHGDKDPRNTPTRVLGELEGQRVIDVACGSFHTVALTADGVVFCWGDNANDQCGSSTLSEAVTRPHGVASLGLIGGGVARGISCGRQHTAVVMQGPHPWCQGHCCKLRHDGRPQCEHGQVYVFGDTSGVGAPATGAQPGPAGSRSCGARLVTGMERYNVSTVVSGLRHTFVLAEVIGDPVA